MSNPEAPYGRVNKTMRIGLKEKNWLFSTQVSDEKYLFFEQIRICSGFKSFYKKFCISFTKFESKNCIRVSAALAATLSLPGAEDDAPSEDVQDGRCSHKLPDASLIRLSSNWFSHCTQR